MAFNMNQNKRHREVASQGIQTKNFLTLFMMSINVRECSPCAQSKAATPCASSGRGWKIKDSRTNVFPGWSIGRSHSPHSVACLERLGWKPSSAKGSQPWQLMNSARLTGGTKSSLTSCTVCPHPADTRAGSISTGVWTS